MEDICSVLRDILKVALDIVDGLPAVIKLFDPFLVVEHVEVGISLSISVNPNVNEPVDLPGYIFSLLGSLLSFFPLNFLTRIATKTFVILEGSSHHRLFVMV